MRVTWDEALDLIARADDRRSADRRGAEAILPFCYGGSNGLLTQDTNDATLFRALRHVAARAHGVRRADRRRQHGALRQDGRRHLRGLPARAADRPLGRQPVGVGHSPRPVHQAKRRSAGAQLVVIDPRTTSLAQAGRPAPRACGPAPTCRSRSRCTAYLFEDGHADDAFLAEHTRRRRRAARARRAMDDRARRGGSGHRRRRRCARFAELYARDVAGADPLRLGPRAQPQRRQRGGGGPGAAGGRRQVRRPRRRLLDEQLRGAGASRPRRG